ncbi:chemotaxis protein CheA [Inediibacterium massiliense]|uniref:chemotaxis protein CheA n=1 Tax=Inediibacterium massiliense TaxID=1658111 RepID=UPI0006B4AB91|nr:chemotaxis protein CheA [Inediibacterium massiliense]
MSTDRFDMEDLCLFLEETKEQIEKIEEELLNLENGPENEESIHCIFRMVHSIKGSSAIMGFEKMSSLAHALESLLSKIREKEIHIDLSIMNVSFYAVDLFKEMYTSICEGTSCNTHIEDILEQINHILKQNKMDKECKEEHHADKELPRTHEIEIVFDEDVEMKCIKAFQIHDSLSQIGTIHRTIPPDFIQVADEDFGDTFVMMFDTEEEDEKIYEQIQFVSQLKNVFITKVQKSACNKEKQVEKISENHISQEKSTIRVDISKIDKILNLVGEFITDKENLNQISFHLKKAYKNDIHIHKLLNTLSHINLVGTQLQETVMGTRMLPLENIFKRFPRMVRDLSLKCNKEVDFIIEGSETEIDRGIIEELVDPITHLLRNAIDHGIEEKEERFNQRKKATGNLKLSAKSEERYVIITLSDDGCGLDVNKIKRKVLEKGLATEDKLNNLSDKEILYYIFEPGFSTAAKVSDISGRGVGLDVVKSNIRKLHGMIDIQTNKGQGTSFIIKLPLTLAISQALIIKEQEYTFALPVYNIIEILRVKNVHTDERIHKVGGIEIFHWREEAIPLICLEKYFQIENQIPTHKVSIIIVAVAERKFGFVVNRIVKEQQIVIKSISDFVGENQLLGNLQDISGVSILGDGTLAYIMDISSVSKNFNQ